MAGLVKSNGSKHIYVFNTTKTLSHLDKFSYFDCHRPLNTWLKREELKLVGPKELCKWTS